ncbi:MAG: hypothetical protein JJT82_08180 [Legionellaceae bacterium]|nr:hypothetical protein [Legionellaceae bacterium]
MEVFKDKVKALYSSSVLVGEDTEQVQLKSTVDPHELCEQYRHCIAEQFCTIIVQKNAQKAYKELSVILHPDKIVHHPAIAFLDAILQKHAQQNSFIYLGLLKQHAEVVSVMALEQRFDALYRQYAELGGECADRLAEQLESEIELLLEEQLAHYTLTYKTPAQHLLVLKLVQAHLNREKLLASVTGIWLDTCLASRGGVSQQIATIIDNISKKYQAREFFPDPDPRDDLEQFVDKLREHKKRTTDITTRALLESLVFLLDGMSQHRANLDVLQSRMLTVLSGATPFLAAGITLGLYLPGLCLFVATLRMLHYHIDHKIPLESKTFGSRLQEHCLSVTKGTEKLGASAIFSVVGLNFLICNGAFYMINASLSAISYCHSFFKGTNNVLPSYQDYIQEKHFRFPFVAMVAYDIESYIHQQEQQWLASWQKGRTKGKMMQRTLQTIQGIDRTAPDEYQAYARVAEQVALLANNDFLSRSGNRARRLVEMLQLRVGQKQPLDVVKLGTEGDVTGDLKDQALIVKEPLGALSY